MSTQPEPDAVECEETLSKKYHKLWLAARNLENVYGQDLQKQINQLLPEFLIMQKIVDELDMFSLNENIDDLTLSTIPFILCDAITGILYSKKFTDQKERPFFIEEANKNFKKFHMTCVQFDNIGMPSVNVPGRETSKTKQDVANRRNLLIAGNKEEKTLNSEIDHFLSRLEKQGINEIETQMDDDFIKEMYLKAITQMNIYMRREQENLVMEANFLKNPVKVDPKEAARNKKLPPPRKPIIITKDALQKKVFGKGYPSVPSMTVEEFADLELSKVMPSPEFAIYKRQVEAMKARQGRAREIKFENQEKEEDPDEETEESLAKARRWDEYKDDHRRGEGNRHNMG